MSTTTGWEIPPDPIVNDQPKGRRPYQETAPAAPPPDVSHAPREEPAPRPAPAKPKTQRNPITKWYGDMRADMAARKKRADGRWWFMRWMNEQPTSVADYLFFVLHERYKRRDGRKGWGLTTEAWLIDGVHAFLFRFHGLTLGLALSLAAYALGWVSQRPGRFYLAVILTVFVLINLNTWLAR